MLWCIGYDPSAALSIVTVRTFHPETVAVCSESSRGDLCRGVARRSRQRRRKEHAKHFILALCEEFEDDLIVVLDGAPYFQASAVTDLAARDDLAFVTLPADSPELNPVEECWRQLQLALSNRFIDSLSELTTAIDTALDQLSISEMSTYF